MHRYGTAHEASVSTLRHYSQATRVAVFEQLAYLLGTLWPEHQLGVSNKLLRPVSVMSADLCFIRDQTLVAKDVPERRQIFVS